MCWNHFNLDCEQGFFFSFLSLVSSPRNVNGTDQVINKCLPYEYITKIVLPWGLRSVHQGLVTL